MVAIAERLSLPASELGIREGPKWTPETFLRPVRENTLPLNANILLNTVDPKHYTPQLDPATFTEFELTDAPYPANLMRADGCGVCSVHMVNLTLGGELYEITCPTVGGFAQAALSNHTNDLRREDGSLVQKGTPVYSERAGWYHDGLVYASVELTGLEAYRQQEIKGWEEVASECLEKFIEYRDVLCVVSVNNVFWRDKRNETPSNATHLVVVNGFEVRNKKVVAIRVTDPYIDPKTKSPKDKINQWIKVTKRIKEAFRGRAIFFVK